MGWLSLRIVGKVLAIFIILIISICSYILFFYIESAWIRAIGVISLTAIIIVWMLVEYATRSRNRKTKKMKTEQGSVIKRLILMNPDGGREKEWHCEGVASFLIGKGTSSSAVDIELGDTQYCDYISNEHAVLNNMQGIWYLEDLGSTNGVGLKKKGEEYTLRLKASVAYKVDEGDIIYISKAKILVR
jgi:hypothetical protein